MKKERTEESRRPLEKLLAKKEELTVSLEQIARQNQQLEYQKQALNVSKKWFDEREVEVGDERRLGGMAQIKNIQSETLNRFRACYAQRNSEQKEDVKQLQAFTNKSPTNSLSRQGYGVSRSQVDLAKRSIAYLTLYWRYVLKEREVQINVELNRLQRLIDKKQGQNPLIRWLDRRLVEKIDGDQKPSLLSRWYSQFRGFKSFEASMEDENMDLFPDSVLKLKEEMEALMIREQRLLETVQQLREANRELQRISVRDGLTGVANRRHFDGFLEQEWKRAVREATPLSLILIDIDFFKGYNDTYGHQEGDECLKQMARTLSGTVNRPGDLVARYGGEEFVVVLANTDAKMAAALAEKLRVRVEAQDLPYTGSKVSPHVTISVGVATAIPDQNVSSEALIQAADQALYQAKKEGRNQVKTAPIALEATMR